MTRATGSNGVSSSIRARSRSGRSRARVMLVAGMMSAGVLTGVAGLGVVTSSAVGARAIAARTISLNDTGHLHRTSGRGITINQALNEMGTASGTIKGTIYIHLKVVSPSRVTAEVNIYPSGGSITGYATASYRLGADVGTASFSGTMSINRGTGSYAHAHGSGLSFSGTIQRLSDAVTVHVSGKMST
jgi:hypothetical protein